MSDGRKRAGRATDPMARELTGHLGESTMAWQRTTRTYDDPDLSLLRLGYFCALLTDAYRAAREGGLHQDTSRATRVGLGIDIPELDVVTIWSTRSGEGGISIPYADFILGQILRALDECTIGLAESGTAGRVLWPVSLADRRGHSTAASSVPGGL